MKHFCINLVADMIPRRYWCLDGEKYDFKGSTTLPSSFSLTINLDIQQLAVFPKAPYLYTIPR